MATKKTKSSSESEGIDQTEPTVEVQAAPPRSNAGVNQSDGMPVDRPARVIKNNTAITQHVHGMSIPAGEEEPMSFPDFFAWSRSPGGKVMLAQKMITVVDEIRA